MKFVYPDFFGKLFAELGNRVDELKTVEIFNSLRSIASIGFKTPGIHKLIEAGIKQEISLTKTPLLIDMIIHSNYHKDFAIELFEDLIHGWFHLYKKNDSNPQSLLLLLRSLTKG